MAAAGAIGCDSREDRRARAEAAENKIMLAKARADLTRARNEIAELEAQLEAVAQARDELDQQVGLLANERDRAANAARGAEAMAQKLTARSGDRDRSVAALEAQITQLKEVVQQQMDTIAQQQATIAELQRTLAQPGMADALETAEIEESIDPNTPPGDI